MRISSISTSAARIVLIVTLLAAAVGPGLAQTSPRGLAALPHVPYWWTAKGIPDIDLVPLLWFNDIDGGVIGAAGRGRLGQATLYFGLAFGTLGSGGQPAGIEMAAELENGGLSFRKLSGRLGLSLAHQAISPKSEGAVAVSFGVASVRVDDPRYLDTITFFDCPANAPSFPCTPSPAPYTWSAGTDNSLTGSISWGDGVLSSPAFQGSALAGLKIFGGEHEYLRAELSAATAGPVGPHRWWTRLAAGFASEKSPQQRRFLLEGADPVTRWLNPYIEAPGALFADIPYFVPGGPNLRAYEETRPLVKSYVGLSAALDHWLQNESGFWGKVAAFGEAAWTPGVPATVGPETINRQGDFLFDWEKLPEGEGKERGQFRAGVLPLPKLWADAGIGISGGYRQLAVTLSFPLWASEPAFATPPIGGGGDSRSAFALRWNLSVLFVLNAEAVCK